MPLIEPPGGRRDKIVLCAEAGIGKTSAALSIAYWAWKANDKRRFWFLDFDDSAGDLLLDEKFKGIDNIEVITPAPKWEEWLAASEKALENAQKGDWIIGDMIDRGWRLVQSWETETLRRKSSADEKLELAKQGKSGWDLFKENNWQVINSQWDAFIKPLLLSSPAHLFFTTEVQDLGKEGRGNEPEDIKNARQAFGRYKPAGQKSLPYQVRSILRLDRLARGRVLYTLKDRARKELSGETCNDFFQDYLLKNAGWKYTDG